METSASCEARYAPLLYPNQSYGFRPAVARFLAPGALGAFAFGGARRSMLDGAGRKRQAMEPSRGRMGSRLRAAMLKLKKPKMAKSGGRRWQGGPLGHHRSICRTYGALSVSGFRTRRLRTGLTCAAPPALAIEEKSGTMAKLC
jgi:hypothetical protein